MKEWKRHRTKKSIEVECADDDFDRSIDEGEDMPTKQIKVASVPVVAHT